MDTLKRQLVDANRARKIITNTHDRLRKLRRQTDEEYLKILIDEVNKYFSTLDTTILNTRDLPTTMEGPRSSMHNQLVNNAVQDIDIIHAKQRVAEELITKAVNYMSGERTGISKSASKLHSRIIGHKLRSASNDRGLIIFTEFFNDEGLTDVQSSKAIRVDKPSSSLTLEPVVEQKDNSGLIDPDSLRIVVEFDEKNTTTDNLPAGMSSLYPLANQLNETEFTMGYGRTLSKMIVGNKNANLVNATALDPARAKKIKPLALKDGFAIGDNVESQMGEFSYAEFELVWSDFREVPTTTDTQDAQVKLKAVDAVQRAIGDAGFGDSSISIDPSHMIIDNQSGKSFSGSNNQDGSDGNYPDDQIPPKKIKNLTFKFELKEGASVPGNLTRININFLEPSTTGGFIPKIDYARSLIITSEGAVVRPFINPPDSIQNSVVSARSLMLNEPVNRPQQFSISFKVEGDSWDEIKEYIGAYWRFSSEGNSIAGRVAVQDAELPSEAKYVTTKSDKTFYIYHDYIRTETGKDYAVNLDAAKEIIYSSQEEIS